jgi:excisionase family DNA binding protein
METEFVQTTSSNITCSDGVQSARPTLITVKEAAQRLGISTSTVYRVDRHHGPFSFIVDGRWIFIDRTSFESYLANSRGIPASDNRQDAPDQPKPVDDVGPQSEIGESQVEPFKNLPLSALTPTSRSGGQRELIITDRRGPFVVLYVS